MKIGIFSECIIFNPPVPAGVSRFFREITTELARRLERLVYNQFNLTIVPTQGIKDKLQRRGFNGPFRFFPTCLDLQSLPQPSSEECELFRQNYGLSNKKIILFVGRMSPEKNIEEVLQLIPEVVKREPSAHFLMVGTGPFLDDYRKLVQEWQLAHSVTFTGYLSDFELFTAMSISDVGLIFAKDAQIFDMTLLEYWYSGLPLIIKNAMGIEKVVNKGTGLLFDDSKEAINHILTLLQDETLRSKMQNNCRQTFELHYDIRKTILQLEKLYKFNDRKG